MPTDNPLDSLANSAAALAKEIYGDVASPAARKLGGALETVFKVGLSPISMLDWGFEQTKVWLAQKIEDRANQTPIENRTSPRIQIAVAAVNGVASCADTPSLRDLYAELLLKAIDSRSADLVHPSFPSVIEQLTPAEALIFMSFSSKAEDCLFQEVQGIWPTKSSRPLEAQFIEHCESFGLTDRSDMYVALTNLQRLGLLHIAHSAESSYLPEEYGGRDRPSVDTTEYRDLRVTDFGRAFLLACSPPSP